MISIKTAVISLSAMILSAGAAVAQNTMNTGSMPGSTSGSMAKPMSAADTKKMQSCQAMDHDAMMKNKGCMKMMKMHPEMSGATPEH